MLTTDSIYFKPLKPVITIKTTANPASNLYRFDSFTGTVTDGPTNIFPLYCSVSLSLGTHGQFSIQFDDPNRTLESTVTVGSRVIIHAGKQSSQLTRLLSGVVRTKGYMRGSNNRLLYLITGSSTGIRLNEILTYIVYESPKLADGTTPDPAQLGPADALVQSVLDGASSDLGLLTVSNLAANSDVHTGIPSMSVEYGEVQDAINFIQEMSSSLLVVDTTDVTHLRFELKNTLFGRGFTLKNSYSGAATDDADDTMYLRSKNWTYEDQFYKSADYSNKLTGILQTTDNRPGSMEDLGFNTELNFQAISSAFESAVKFRPTHSRFLLGDIYIVGASFASVAGGSTDWWARICTDSGGVPQNAGGIVVNMLFRGDNNWTVPEETVATENYHLGNIAKFYDASAPASGVLLDPQEFWLDTTKDYWFIISNQGIVNKTFQWGRDQNNTVSNTGYAMRHSSGFSDAQNGGSGWTQVGAGQGLPCLALDRYRSSGHIMWDPKAAQAIQSGLTQGQYIESLLSQTGIDVKDRPTMYKYMARQLYERARPRTVYNFPTVVAPNIPPVPGDPIIISDNILNISTPGNQILITSCGDMTYTWGNMGSGGYEAPTVLNLQAVAIHPRYR